MTSAESPVAIVGTGLIGTSVALAAAGAGATVTGWDANARTGQRAAERAGFTPATTLEDAVDGARVVVVAAPIPAIPELVARCLKAAPDAVVTDVGSIKGPVVRDVTAIANGVSLQRYVPGHPMGGSERSGPEHASASLVDGIVWAITPTAVSSPTCIDRMEGWVTSLGARPIRIDPERHDRLVAIVSHLPQVASTALMDMAATDEADEPEILLLAAGGFRDLTRLAASDPALWSEILLANDDAIVAAVDRFMASLRTLRDQIHEGRGDEVEATFEAAKRARLQLAAKPQVRAGVAVLLVPVPDRPGSLAQLTGAMSEAGINIEDLQIVHSAEGGRGTVHLTVAASAAIEAEDVLTAHRFDPTRLA